MKVISGQSGGCVGLCAILLHVRVDEVHPCSVATWQPVSFSCLATRYENVRVTLYL